MRPTRALFGVPMQRSPIIAEAAAEATAERANAHQSSKRSERYRRQRRNLLSDPLAFKSMPVAIPINERACSGPVHYKHIAQNDGHRAAMRNTPPATKSTASTMVGRSRAGIRVTHQEISGRTADDGVQQIQKDSAPIPRTERIHEPHHSAKEKDPPKVVSC